MQPYFLTHHIAALLILVTMMAWGMMELSQISQEHRDRARKVGAPVLRIVMLACLAAAVAVVNLVPRLVPVARDPSGPRFISRRHSAATRRPGAARMVNHDPRGVLHAQRHDEL